MVLNNWFMSALKSAVIPACIWRVFTGQIAPVYSACTVLAQCLDRDSAGAELFVH